MSEGRPSAHNALVLADRSPRPEVCSSPARAFAAARGAGGNVPGAAELARELLVACAHIDVPEGTCEAASIDLSQVVPSEYRADAVTVMRGERGPRTAIVVEVQLRVDPGKRWTWPLYVAALRARVRCDAALLVLAPDEVATWARHPIELGHPRFTLEPIVVAFSELPRIANADDAARAPELAVLSVLAHRDLPSATFALDAMQQLPDDARRLYLDLVLNALPAAQRQIWRPRC